jgi:sigma-B regulation protein RsbU (phosphoserine phosphatase)
MSTAQQIESSLAGELELARQVQTSLLPKRDCCLGTWSFAYTYEPAGALSGDYVDLISDGPEDFYFALGDVSGKGIAASMLMSHLHSTLRALVSAGMGIEEILKRASGTFCQSSLSAQFATLVLGRADQKGNIELVNAGHTPVLVTEDDEVRVIESGSLPLGLFCMTDFEKTRVHLSPGNFLLAYSDGITESTNPAGEEYGINRLKEYVREAKNMSPAEVVQSISAKIGSFTRDMPLTDDRTILVLGR